MSDENRPDRRAPQRATGRDINLYIIERLYDEIKLNNGPRGPRKRLIIPVLSVAEGNGSTPKSPVGGWTE